MSSVKAQMDSRVVCQAGLEAILAKHRGVPGVSVGLISGDYQVASVNAGYSRAATNDRMTNDTYLECASLSKTVCAAFAHEYFMAKGIPMTTCVNSLLHSVGSSWTIELPPPGSPKFRVDMVPSWTNEVTLAMLVNHTALGMHYVYGIPLNEDMPSPLQFLDGSAKDAGYDHLYLEKRPGSSFSYSGGGFVVMQHLLESMEGKHIDDIMRPFLDACGMQEFSFYPNPKNVKFAYGHFTRDKEVQPKDGGRLAFPALAAGGVCTAQALGNFLACLARAYKGGGNGPISHATAQWMLGEHNWQDLGAFKFMRSFVGHGTFVALTRTSDGQENRIMMHQAANEGFRGVYFVCFEGPDAGKGFCLMCNGDNPAVFFQSEACRFLLTDCLNIGGIQYKDNSLNFSMDGISQEQIVNLGLKELVMNGFIGNDGSRMKSKL